MIRLARLFLLFALLIPVSVPALHAAAAGGVDGTVLDPDSKAVVNAAVVVRNEATGVTVATTTDGSGRFSAAGLAQGSYAIEVLVPGFEPVRRAGIQVNEGAAATVSIQLSVANISETVTVSAALPAAAVAAPSQASLT
ncbi:MAG TPA: carboxypeptidase-like regulatory domain-containing protein, partial [Vicinamibacterales bacterium]|nr:carboxypeptidase-like regulatory domain-containing protein [Vicinamibacterales bacterium]